MLILFTTMQAATTIFKKQSKSKTQPVANTQASKGLKGGAAIPMQIIQPPPVEQANIEIEKEKIKNKQASLGKLEKLVKESQLKLFSAKSVFPLDLFPDQIEIDPVQVHITLKEFFKSKRIHSIAIKDISDVFIESAGPFASLKLIDRDFVENTVSVNFLKYADALKAKKIIQGLMVADREGIDLTQADYKSLAVKLEQLGSASEKS